MARSNAYKPESLVPLLIAVIMTFLYAGAVQQQNQHQCPEPLTVTETVYIETEPAIVKKFPFYQQVVENMTEEDYRWLAAAVKEEAGNQSMTGQRAVVEVIFNRVLDPRFPDTIKGVITQKGQFSTLPLLSTSKPGQAQYDAIEAVANATEPILPSDVLYFASVQTGYRFYEKIGGHYFYYG